jgi:hypothetical protein
MNAAGLLLCSEVPITVTSSEPHKFFKTSIPCFFNSHLILTFHLRLGLPSVVFPSGLLLQFCTHFVSLHTCYLTFVSHILWFQSPQWRFGGIQIMKFLIMQFSAFFCCIICLKSIYSSQLTFLRDPHSMPFASLDTKSHFSAVIDVKKEKW